MPELPEVETHRRHAEQHLVGRRVTHVSTRDQRVLRNTSAQGLGVALADATIEAAERTGKWLCLRTDQPSDVLVHLGMTGAFHDHPDGDTCQHDHVVLTLHDGGAYALYMQRLFGGVWLARDAGERREITGPLGRDALDVDGDDLQALLADSRAGLKSALMDQDRIAGLGNLLSDELCWQIQEHPATPCRELDDEVFDRLADALAHTLDVGLDLGHAPTTEGFLLEVRDDEDAACPRCGADLVGDTIAGRSSLWCTNEQPDPR